MKKIISYFATIVFVTVTPLTIEAQQQCSWQYLDQPGFYPQQTGEPTIVSSDTALYVSFEMPGTDVFVYYYSLNQPTLQQLGGSVSGGVSGLWPTIALNSDGQPFAAYRPQDELQHKIRTLSSNDWIDVGSIENGSSQTFVMRTYLKVLGETPYVIYENSAGSSIVEKHDGTNWIQVGDYLESDNFMSFNSSLYVHLDELYATVLTHEGNENFIRVLRLEDNTWVQLGEAFQAQTTFSGNVDFDPQTGEPVISYIDQNQATTVRKYNGSSWDIILVDNSIERSKLIILEDELHLVSSHEDGDFRVQKYIQGSWEEVSSFDIGYTLYSFNVTLFEGKLCVAYLDPAYGYKPSVIELNCVCTTNCPADINEDLVVNVSDLLTFMAYFGTECEACPCIGDMNEDLVVNVSDLLTFMAYFGTECQ